MKINQSGYLFQEYLKTRQNDWPYTFRSYGSSLVTGSFLYYSREFFDQHFDPNLPITIRWDSAKGLVIFGKENATNDDIVMNIPGAAQLVPDEVLQTENMKLCIKDHPSIIEDNGQRLVVWGPAALLSHSCDSEYGLITYDNKDEVF